VLRIEHWLTCLFPRRCDTHVYGRLKESEDGGLSVSDTHGGSYGFYNDVAGILASIEEKGCKMGVASRTSATDIANQLLRSLRIPRESGESKPALSAFEFVEIYPGSKKNHFQRIHKKSGVPYQEMLFFDDESRNKNVEELGVVMQLIRDGVTRAEVDRGVGEWRRKNHRSKKQKPEGEDQ